MYVIVLTALSEQNLQKPYVYYGRPYQRIESTTTVMKQSRYHELLFLQKSCFSEWETATAISPCELDDNQIRRMVKLSVKTERIPEESLYETSEEILQHLGLIRNQKITNAAAILFGTHLEFNYPQCVVKLARFKGEDKLHGFIDNKQFYGNAFALLDYAENFLKTYLPISSTFVDNSFQRKDELAIPFLALREALVNAVCHRDYSDRSGEITVAVYDTSVEIWSKGKLPDNLTIHDLTQKHASCPRNKLISEVFYKCGYIEKWGSGTLRMIELCKKRNLPEPKYSEYSGGFSIEFSYHRDLAMSDESALKKVTLQKYESKLTAREKEILKLFFNTNKLTSAMIVKNMKSPPSQRTIRNDLAHLQELGLIDKKGKYSKVTWHLKKDK